MRSRRLRCHRSASRGEVPTPKLESIAPGLDCPTVRNTGTQHSSSEIDLRVVVLCVDLELAALFLTPPVALPLRPVEEAVVVCAPEQAKGTNKKYTSNREADDDEFEMTENAVL